MTTPAFAQQAQTGASGTGSGAASQLGLTAPGERQGRYLERDGARIFYQTFGQGEPMLLLHGYPLSGALFARVVDTLADRNLVITVDHRGYGQSEAPGVPSSVETYAADALAVLDELGLSEATVGGMSMGGPIALSMFDKAPDRFSGLVLIDTIAAKANPAEAGLWNGVERMVEKNGVGEIVPFLLPYMLSGDTRLNEEAQADYLSAIMQQCSRDAALGGAKALAERPDRMGMLSSIKVPTLIIVGMEDQVYPIEIAKMMQGAIPNAKLHIVPGAAHAAIFEAPDNAAQAISNWRAS